MNRKVNTKTAETRFWRFSNYKAWIIVISLILIVPLLYRYLRAQIQKNEVQEQEIKTEKDFYDNQNPTVALAKANKITPDKGVQEAAKLLSHHLGTKYMNRPDLSWWNPLDWAEYARGWTENDAEVRKILIYQQRNYYLLQKLYNQVYTSNRNLTSDILKYLDKDELKEVQKRIKL